MKKRFWPSSPRIIECDKLQEQPISVQKFFDNYCGKYNILSVTLERLLETQFFEKKNTFPLKNFLAVSFSYHRLKKTLSNYLLGSRMSFSNYGASNKINSLGPKKSIVPIFFKLKAIVPMKNRFWPNYTHNTDFCRHRHQKLLGFTRYFSIYDEN